MFPVLSCCQEMTWLFCSYWWNTKVVCLAHGLEKHGEIVWWPGGRKMQWNVFFDSNSAVSIVWVLIAISLLRVKGITYQHGINMVSIMYPRVFPTENENRILIGLQSHFFFLTVFLLCRLQSDWLLGATLIMIFLLQCQKTAWFGV